MKINLSKKQKKLSPKDFLRMWGEDGPYSEVNLIEQMRILDDSISRIFFVVEAKINPFTFEFVQRHRKQFDGDETVLQLLDHAEYRGDFGYMVEAVEVELQDEDSKRFARKQADITMQTVIRMHKFVINEFDLRPGSEFGVINDDKKLVWNENFGGVGIIDDGLWDSKSFISSPAGVKNNKMRFYIVLAFEKNFNFKADSARAFSKILKDVSKSFGVEIEDVNIFKEYTFITALIPFDIAPAQFIESVLNECNKAIEHIFQKDYFVSNVKKPTQEEILSFLRQLPLDKDIRMGLQ